MSKKRLAISKVKFDTTSPKMTGNIDSHVKGMSRKKTLAK